MKERINCRKKLIDLVEAHILKITVANEYLVNIRRAITENQLENLSKSLADPPLPVDDIESLERQRHLLLIEYGFSADYAGFEECVGWCDNDTGQVSDLYQLLVQALLELQHSIQINSLLVSKGRDRVRRSIGILTGLGNDANHKTYSSNGKTEQQLGQRNIAIA